MSIRKIAQTLKSSPSTISWEIKRNSSKIKASRGSYTKYFPIKSNDKYIDRRKAAIEKVNFLKMLLII